MREASGAPRNSRELAVRNQFFTPRYVVQFLVDNSLGRQWFEMTKGQTALIDSCQYIVKRKQEVFLEKGEEIPEAKIEGANYIEYRALKDPREILMLDPACGSMHFGLYCFDLFEQIYLEAWDNHPALMTDLRDKYMRNDFIKRIPGYILRHNIHGVDIDPRAIQIAGLSLWLRAQKSYDKLGLQPADRPAISKSNLVIAEPMPGDVQLLNEFTKSLPGPIGKLVRVIWDKMQLAGETGLLLKIEEELKKEIEIAKEEYEEYKNTSVQSTLFDSPAESKAAEMAAIYGKGQKITKDFFDTAEEEVLKALKGFAENAEGEDAFQKLLFAEDTARGFAFIELCRKRYDVIVMNPPFGAGTISSKKYLDSNYIQSKSDLYAIFLERNTDLLKEKGFTAQITNRTGFFLSSLSKWRTKIILEHYHVNLFADLGSGILDAMVETAAYIFTKGVNKQLPSTFYDLLKTSESEKESQLESLIKVGGSSMHHINTEKFNRLKNANFAYWIPEELYELIEKNPQFESQEREARIGLSTGDDFQFIRIWTEVLNTKEYWKPFAKGGEYSPYYSNIHLVVNWKNEGKEIRNFKDERGKLRSRPQNISYFFKPGITWTRRTSSNLSFRILPAGCVFGDKGPSCFTGNNVFWIGILQSSAFQVLVEAQLAAGDAAARSYETGIIQSTPVPSEQLIEKITKSKVEELVIELIQVKRSLNCYDEINRSYLHPPLINHYRGDIKNAILQYNNERKRKNELVKELHRQIDSIVYELYSLKVKPQQKTIFKLAYTDHTQEIMSLISWSIGVYFGRWDLELARRSTLDTRAEINTDVVGFPVGMIQNRDSLNNGFAYSSSTTNTGALYSIKNGIHEILKSVFEENYDSLLIDIYDSFGVDDLSLLLNNGRFFDHHLSGYSLSRRKAPIYWPIATKSNSFVVWLYYPALNNNTLFSVVNELVDPKIKAIAKEVEVLEMKGSAKELNEQKEFLAELEDFKEELLRVAQLPYKPNQDDGVLITAAPLHNLFRHTKWKKSTHDCWKKLEKGEYDWAHLAYSIWPDRVRKKCVKDLSMAIAQGLEEICEIQPKEKKVKKPKEIKAKAQKKLI